MDEGRNDLTYRLCVGVMVLNRDGRAFVGRRNDFKDAIPDRHLWQMPQGGIDSGEEPWDAAIRELYEETNIRSIERLAESSDWFSYDLPADILGNGLKGRYRGQTQKWFAVRFTGDESEINISEPGGGGYKAEFDAWRWNQVEALPDLIVPFKRRVYDQVIAEFRHLVG